jgi:glycosyltransferase involved in cell wall biosynthesis
MIRRGYPADSGRVMTLAVDTDSFVPRSEETRAALQENLKLRPPVIGFMGRLVHAKGLRVLMQAIQGLDPATEWSLLLLGSGEMDREIRQWAAERGWTERVRIHLAKHDEVPKYLPAMDLLLAPSQTMANWKEQFGRMLVEAFASGVPVIASDSGEIPHVIGDAGSILPERDVARWTAEINRYLKNPDLRRSKAAAGLRRVKQFSVEELARQHKQLFRELLNTPVATRGYASAIDTGQARVYGSN